jgi:hypothetical protein
MLQVSGASRVLGKERTCFRVGDLRNSKAGICFFLQTEESQSSGGLGSLELPSDGPYTFVSQCPNALSFSVLLEYRPLGLKAYVFIGGD